MQPREVVDDMAALSPEACDYVRQTARRLDASEHGGATAIVQEAAAFLGLSVQTLYRHLKSVAGWSSGRKARSDKGSTSVTAEALVTLGAAQREAMRENGKQTLFTTTARGMLEQNGVGFGVSNEAVKKLVPGKLPHYFGCHTQGWSEPLRPLAKFAAISACLES